MSRKYKFHNPEGIYFVSFAIVYWIDIFVRECYYAAMVESLEYCRKNKGLELFAYCIQPSHVHLIFRDKNNNPGKLLGELKTFTSKKLQEIIIDNPTESRTDQREFTNTNKNSYLVSNEWLIWFMEQAGTKNSNIKKRQFWQQHNKPIELWSNEVIQQKLDYVHNNPVESGFVTEPHYWKYSSAINYSGGLGVIEIDSL